MTILGVEDGARQPGLGVDVQGADKDALGGIGVSAVARPGAAKAAGVTIVTDFDRKPFEAAMAGIYEKAQRDPAAAALIERIRKVE